MSKPWLIVVIVLGLMDAVWTGLFIAMLVWINKHYHPRRWW